MPRFSLAWGVTQHWRMIAPGGVCPLVRRLRLEVDLSLPGAAKRSTVETFRRSSVQSCEARRRLPRAQSCAGCWGTRCPDRRSLWCASEASRYTTFLIYKNANGYHQHARIGSLAYRSPSPISGPRRSSSHSCHRWRRSASHWGDRANQPTRIRGSLLMLSGSGSPTVARQGAPGACHLALPRCVSGMLKC